MEDGHSPPPSPAQEVAVCTSAGGAAWPLCVTLHEAPECGRKQGAEGQAGGGAAHPDVTLGAGHPREREKGCFRPAPRGARRHGSQDTPQPSDQFQPRGHVAQAWCTRPCLGVRMAPCPAPRGLALPLVRSPSGRASGRAPGTPHVLPPVPFRSGSWLGPQGTPGYRTRASGPQHGHPRAHLLCPS